MVILAEIGDGTRFQTKRALASYAGLCPVVRESAGKKKRGAIGHHGWATLRWMERPQFEPPSCAHSTNRSVSAIYSQIPDNYALLHRRMTTKRDGLDTSKWMALNGW